MTKARRPAFTLIELLVVIAILGILIAILVPAVQKVRHASARTQCINNLKNIGTAICAYHDAYKYFPGAYETPKTNPSDFKGAPTTEPGWSWGVKILPFIDQGALYEALGAESTKFQGAPATPGWVTVTEFPLGQTPLKIYRCPSDIGPDLNALRGDFAISNYRCAVGANLTPPFSAPGVVPVVYTFQANWDYGGVMFQNSKVTMVMVTDGTSNTISVGECIYDQDANATPAGPRRATIWTGMRGINGGIFISDVMWWLDDAAAAINGDAPQAFSSRHGGGANFLFCDVTVRFARQEISPSIVKGFANRDDGLTPPLQALDY